jgi:hypothetical protein
LLDEFSAVLAASLDNEVLGYLEQTFAPIYSTKHLKRSGFVFHSWGVVLCVNW